MIMIGVIVMVVMIGVIGDDDHDSNDVVNEDNAQPQSGHCFRGVECGRRNGDH